MSENFNNKYFIVLNKGKIIFSCLDKKKKSFLHKDIILQIMT